MTDYKNRFNEILSGTKSAGMYEPEIREITETYPWFSFGKIMLIKSLLAKNNTKEVEKIREQIAPVLMTHNCFSFLYPIKRRIITGNPKDEITTKIIDNFLNNPPKKIALPPINTSSKHKDLGAIYDEDIDFATEILAEIFIRQALFDKAIDIYNKLILKYPEKNTYFASRIDFVNGLKIAGEDKSNKHRFSFDK